MSSPRRSRSRRAAENSPCPSGGVPPFAPQVAAYPEDMETGAYSPFDLRITRNDGEQEITGFSSQFRRA